MGNSGWHAESEPHVTPMRNEADSTLTQVVVPFLWHWEAALMLCPLREGSRGDGWDLLARTMAGSSENTEGQSHAVRGFLLHYTSASLCFCSLD